MVTRGFHPQRPEHSAVAEPADYEFQCGHTHPSGFTCKSAVEDGPVFRLTLIAQLGCSCGEKKRSLAVIVPKPVSATSIFLDQCDIHT